jgi:nucleotide-binding universal stress UspA family protein
MQLNRILLPFNLKEQCHACAEAAFRLAHRFGAEIEGCFPRPPLSAAVPYATEATPPALIEEMMERARAASVESVGRAEAIFQAWAKAHPEVAASFRAIEGHIDETIARRARLADLSVVAPISREDGAFWRFVRDGALMLSGRPVLIVPRGGMDSRAGETVVIGWKDSIEVSRAIAAARPFIAAAKRVRIVAVGGSTGIERQLAEVAAPLRRSQSAVETKVLPGTQNVADALVQDAEAVGQALLVIGAYSHWRWREWAFGGVTEQILHETRVPVLMAH